MPELSTLDKEIACRVFAPHKQVSNEGREVTSEATSQASIIRMCLVGVPIAGL